MDIQQQIQWFNPKIGIPIITIMPYGIMFRKKTVAIMGTPEYIKFGFDSKNQIIAFRNCDAEDINRIAFKRKMKKGYVRINNKDMARLINAKSGSYLGNWNIDTLTIDLVKGFQEEVEKEGEGDVKGN